MAIVYSLICWGGRTGKSVAASNSSGLIFTLTAHGLRDGAGVVFSGTTPPGNVTFGTTYYAKSLSTSTISIYAESTLTNRVPWSSAGSGVIAQSKKMLDYFNQYPGRWGGIGSEQCYDGVSSWISGRSSASSFDSEIGEIGESFTDTITSQQTINIPSAKNILTTTVAGQRSSGWHGGNFPSSQTLTSGYEIYCATAMYGYLLVLQHYTDVVEGLIVRLGMWENTGGIYLQSAATEALNNIIVASGPGVGIGNGIRQSGALSKSKNNLIIGWNTGVFSTAYAAGVVCANNTVSSCTTGIKGESYSSGYYYNNISVGNTTNWGTYYSTIEGADKNAGLSGEAWIKGTGTRLTIATTDFESFANKNFRPEIYSSPQVDSGVFYYGISQTDITDAECPNYNNGSAEYIDVGAYEFDHGYGLRPVTATLTLTGLSSGTDVVVRTAGTSTILDSVDSTTGDWGYTYTTPHSVDIDVIKPGMVIVTFRGLSLTSTSSSIPISQQFDRNYA